MVSSGANIGRAKTRPTRPFATALLPPEACTCDEVNKVDGIIHSESYFSLALLRVQAFSKADVAENLPPIQQGFGIKKLSDFCEDNGPVPDILPDIFFVPLLASVTPDYFSSVNQIMEFITIHPSEEVLFDEFARIGVIPGQPFPPPGMSNEFLQAIQVGILAGRAKIDIEVVFPSMANVSLGWQLVVNPPQWGNHSVM